MSHRRAATEIRRDFPRTAKPPKGDGNAWHGHPRKGIARRNAERDRGPGGAPPHLKVAGVDPGRQLVDHFVEALLVLLHVGGAGGVAQVLQQLLADLQPAAHVLLLHLGAEIVHPGGLHRGTPRGSSLGWRRRAGPGRAGPGGRRGGSRRLSESPAPRLRARSLHAEPPPAPRRSFESESGLLGGLPAASARRPGELLAAGERRARERRAVRRGPLLLRAPHGGAPPGRPPAGAAAARPGRTSHASDAAASGPSRLSPRAARQLPNFVSAPLAALPPPRGWAGPHDPRRTERLPRRRPVEVPSLAPLGASQTGRALR